MGQIDMDATTMQVGSREPSCFQHMDEYPLCICGLLHSGDLVLSSELKEQSASENMLKGEIKVPILNILAENFNVSYETASRIPTLAQSGYCAGLFFLCPLGDLVRRRAFTLFLIFFTGTVWIGLCVTNNFTVFLTLSFICGFTTVTPQIMLPLVGDLSPPHKRAAALSIVVSGNGGGILIARILSGVVTNFVSWRIIYFIALALQFFIFMLLYLFMPDYPETNTSGLSYYRLLRDVIRMLFKHPVLFQSSLIGFCSSAVFTSFWTTLTGLLAGAPYHYSPLIIGLFALINAAGIVLSPYVSTLN